MTIAAWPSSYRLQCNLNKATCKSLKDHWRKRKVQRCQRVWSGQFCFSAFKVQSLGMRSVSMQQNQQEKQSYSPSMHGCGNLFWEVRHLLHFIYKASSQAQDYYTENTNAKYERYFILTENIQQHITETYLWQFRGFWGLACAGCAFSCDHGHTKIMCQVWYVTIWICVISYSLGNSNNKQKIY